MLCNITLRRACSAFVVVTLSCVKKILESALDIVEAWLECTSPCWLAKVHLKLALTEWTHVIAAQVVGSFSRVGLSLYTYLPPNQTGMFSDSGALNRAVQRPANAFDAFRRAAEEGLSGVWSGVSGTLMDPTQV